jgi:hypothetical protein
MAMRVDYRLSKEGDMARLDYVATVEAEKLGLFMRCMMVFFKLFGRMQLRSFFRRLRQLVETPAAAA